MLSKFLGDYETFKASLKQHGIKWVQNDSFTTFLSIVNHNQSNLLEWYNKSKAVLRDNEKLFLKYVILSGLRKAEAVRSFNKVISLSSQGRLEEYFDKDLGCLKHYAYPNEYLRNTKNVFFTPIQESLVSAISNSQPVSYNSIRKRLERNNLKLRFKECRSYFATYLRNKGVMSESIDLIQGRVGKSVFVRFYLKQDLKSLNAEIIGKLGDLQNNL